MERLDKLLVSQGLGSRKEVQKLVRSGEVCVDGAAVRKPDSKLDPELSEITVSGKRLEYSRFVYIMLNKPSGVVCATEDKADRTVLDILPPQLRRPGLFPAGRLDKDTEGLLIITDDGDYAHKILSPKSHVYKRYYAELDGEPTGETARRFSEGIIFSDGTECLPARLEIAGKTSAYVEICEGKFHQVKKMFLSCGLKVTYLKRVRVGGLSLDVNLPIGQARMMEKNEKNAVFIGN